MNPLLKIAAAFVAVLLAAIAALFLLRSGEAARVETLLRQAVDDARAGEADKCTALVAGDYSFNGETRDQVVSLIRTHARPNRWKVLEVSDIDVEVQGGDARAALQLRVEPADGVPSPYGAWPLRLNLTLTKVGDTWKISGYRVETR